MDFFTLSTIEKRNFLQAKVAELRALRFKEDLPLLYKTPECLNKTELFVYEFKSGLKELISFNVKTLKEKTLLKY
jgi:hypothetical protein